MREQAIRQTKANTAPPLSAFVFLLFLFFIGAAVLTYPVISEAWNESHQQEAAGVYLNAVEELEEEDYSAYLSAAQEYNRNLLSSGTILADPFDFEAFKKNAGKYQDLLNYNEIMATIDIPEIDVLLPIYHGTAEETLAKGIGHLEGTSLPIGGVGTHCVITGHTGLPGKKLFTDIIKLEEKDIFYIHVMNEKLVYQVEHIEVILPDEISKFKLEEDKDYVSLVTCTPYGVNDHRLFVRGTRIFPEELKPEEIVVIEQRVEATKELSTIEKIQLAGAAVAFILFVYMLFMIVTMVRQRKRARRQAGKKRQPRIVVALKVICIYLFVIGVVVFCYPFLRNYSNARRAEELTAEFHAVLDSMEKETTTAQTAETAAEEEAAPDQPDSTEPPRILPDLWDEMQAYNQRLVTEGQDGMRDVLSYEGFAVDISAYDFPDHIFGSVEIPALGRTYLLYLGSSRSNMAKGATVLGESSAPIGGVNTHCVIAAHSSWNGAEMFVKIHTLEMGDLVIVTNPWETLTYRVIGHKQIKPDAFNNLVIQDGKDLLTLFTCYPSGASRWCVFCERVT